MLKRYCDTGLTGANYIASAYPDVKPEEWTPKHEAELPEPFQRWD